MKAFTHFASIWIVLCNGQMPSGEQVAPLHLTALDTHYPKNILQIDIPSLLKCSQPPYPTGPQCLVVTIDANTLAGCHIALGWPVPDRIIDLIVEFRNVANGRRSPCGSGLVGALLWFGLPAAGAFDRDNNPTAATRRVEVVSRLLEVMRPHLDLGRALLRGRYMVAVARMESSGVPVDLPQLDALQAAWPRIRERAIKLIDQNFGIYVRDQFQLDAFASWLDKRTISWPRTRLGELDLSDVTFRDMARVYPELRPLKALRSTLAGFDPSALAIGPDGRNRTAIRPFASRTGRNQPSSKASVLGSAAWVRNLVQPAPGMGLALIDWQQQEFGIAAALSEDASMLAAYATGDPYLDFAMRAGAAPHGATSVTHSDIREQFKACALGVQYGMGPATLARLAKVSEAKAHQLIGWHRSEFPRFWRWSDAIETHGLLQRQLQSVFGWRITIGADSNSRFLRNFPMQANGAEMLRLACCLVTENGVRVCSPLHDAMLIEAKLDDIDAAVAATEQLMGEASRLVLDGLALRTKVKLVWHPQRLSDDRGQSIWRAIEQILVEDVEDATVEQPVRHSDTTSAAAHTRPIYLCSSLKEVPDASD